VIVRYDGREYPFDMDDVTVKQALAIEKFMGCPFVKWGELLQKGGDLRAQQVLGWLILHPDGAVSIEDTDFKLVALGEALAEAYAAQEAAAAPGEPEPVPTGAASTGRTPAAAASSPAS
jgi:hypothetical protein